MIWSYQNIKITVKAGEIMLPMNLTKIFHSYDQIHWKDPLTDRKAQDDSR